MHMRRECFSADEYTEPLVRTNGLTMRVKSVFNIDELEPDASKSVRKFEKLMLREARLANHVETDPNAETGSIVNMLINNQLRLRQLAGVTHSHPEAIRAKNIMMRVESIGSEIEQLIQALIDMVEEQKSAGRMYTTHASVDLTAEPTATAYSATPDSPLTDATYPHQPDLN